MNKRQIVSLLGQFDQSSLLVLGETDQLVGKAQVYTGSRGSRGIALFSGRTGISINDLMQQLSRVPDNTPIYHYNSRTGKVGDIETVMKDGSKVVLT